MHLLDLTYDGFPLVVEVVYRMNFQSCFLKWRCIQLTNNNKAWCFKLSDFLGESANDFLVFHFENLLGTLTMPGAVSFCFNDTFVDFER